MSMERKAEQLLVKAGVDTTPVPVEQVAAQLGIRIESADLGEDCSAVLVRNGDRAVIGVNEDHHPNRRRFSIAHEVAHFVLHEGDTYIDKGYRVHFRDLESGSGTKHWKKWRQMRSLRHFSCPRSGSETPSGSSPLS